MLLSKQTVLITGGCGEIGKTLAIHLAGQCREVLVLDINEAPFAELTSNGIHCFKCDLTDFEQVESSVKSIVREHSEVSVLINCAGMICNSPLLNVLAVDNKKHPPELFDKILKTNLSSTFYVTSCVVEHMFSKRTKGLIINMSSIAAGGNAGQSAYAAAKAGVNALTSTWVKELSPLGIRVAAIAPGFIDTASARAALSSSHLENIKKTIPLKRLGTLDEVVHTTQFIIENDYINGKILELDGGLTL